MQQRRILTILNVDLAGWTRYAFILHTHTSPTNWLLPHFTSKTQKLENSIIHKGSFSQLHIIIIIAVIIWKYSSRSMMMKMSSQTFLSLFLSLVNPFERKEEWQWKRNHFVKWDQSKCKMCLGFLSISRTTFTTCGVLNCRILSAFSRLSLL